MAEKSVKLTMKVDMSGFREAVREAARKYVRDNTTYTRSDGEESAD